MTSSLHTPQPGPHSDCLHPLPPASGCPDSGCFSTIQVFSPPPTTHSDPRESQIFTYLCPLTSSSPTSGLICLVSVHVYVSLWLSFGGALEWEGLRVQRAGLGYWRVIESPAPGISILRSRDIRSSVPGLQVIFLGGSGPMGQWRVHRTDQGESQPQASRSSFGSGGGG